MHQLTKLGRIVCSSLITLVIFMMVAGPLAAAALTQEEANARGQKAAGEANATDANKSALHCSISDTSTIDLCISSVFYYMFPALTSYIAYVAAVFFDYLAHLSINGLAYAQSFIKQAWEIARTFANMAFFFIVVVIAANIVFNADLAGSKKMLATMIMMALLVNFSFFITRTVIDVGNLFAVYFYNSLNAAPLTSAANTAAGGIVQVASSAGISSGVKDLTEPLMRVVNVQNLTSTEAFQLWRGNAGPLASFTVLTVIYIMTALIYLLLTFMFVTAGVKFALRIVTLWLVIILSPFAFAAKVFTATDKMGGVGAMASRGYTLWQQSLVQFSLYPAIFFFIYYVVILVSTGILCTPGDTNTVGAAADQTCSLTKSLFTTANVANGASALNTTDTIINSIAGALIRMTLVVALLFYALKASQSLVSVGNQISNSVSGRILSGATRVVSRLPVVGAGLALGIPTYAAGYGLQKIGFQKSGTTLKNFASGGALEKLDLRNIKPLASAGSAVGSFIKKQTLIDIKPGPAYDAAADKKQQAENAKQRTIQAKEAKEEAIIKKAASTSSPSALTPQERDEFSQVSPDKVAKMDVKTIQSLAPHMTEKQHEAVQNSGREELGKDVKAKIHGAWHSTAAAAPLAQAHDAAKGIEAARNNRDVPLPELTDKLDLHDVSLTSGSQIDIEKAADIKLAVKDAGAAIEANRKKIIAAIPLGTSDADKALATRSAEKDAVKKRKALRAVEVLADKLSDKVGKIENIGNPPAAKKFTIK